MHVSYLSQQRMAADACVLRVQARRPARPAPPGPTPPPQVQYCLGIAVGYHDLDMNKLEMLAVLSDLVV